jgi:hypothetical protein
MLRFRDYDIAGSQERSRSTSTSKLQTKRSMAGNELQTALGVFQWGAHLANIRVSRIIAFELA